MKLIDLIGKKFGRLTVVKYVGKSHWLCRCECGNEKIVLGSHLKSGKIQSCTCLHKQQLTERNTKHNLCRTRLYRTWSSIKIRCYDKNVKQYHNYGGKGITVCKEWLEDFMSFYDWALQNGYKENLTIDRIDNNKGYSPDNCRWVTIIEQQSNKTNNYFITYNNETHTLTEWAKKYNINFNTLRNRLKTLKWDFEKAINIPIQKHS